MNLTEYREIGDITMHILHSVCGFFLPAMVQEIILKNIWTYINITLKRNVRNE